MTGYSQVVISINASLECLVLACIDIAEVRGAGTLGTLLGFGRK